MFKKLMIFIFSLFTSFMISSKIGAIDISYCTYGTSLDLMLPVTIGVDIEAIDLFFPFSELHKLHDNKEYLVYDKYSCETGFQTPYIDEDKYLVAYNYYYKYNGKTFTTFPLNKGVYSNIDVTAPNINSFIDEISVSVSKYLSLDDISKYVNAQDDKDGNIIPEITYDNYSENYNKLGSYSIIFKACDYSNNCSSYQMKINVIDDISPTITGETNFNSYLSSPLSIYDIKSKLKAIDNYDGDISSDIYIKSHNYNKSSPGSYNIFFNVLDKSNNKIANDFKVTINVIDDIAPTIEGPDSYISRLSSIIDSTTIISNLIIEDNIDLNAYKNVYIIDDNYSKNKFKLGTYTLIVGCYDNNGNESSPYHIKINVIDDIAPTIEGETLFNSYISSPLSTTQIIANLIVMDNYDGNIINNLEIYNDTYSNNKTTIGIFEISFIVRDSSSNYSQPHIVQIIVYDDIIPIIEGTNFYRTLTNQKIDSLSLLLSLSASDNIDGDITDKIVLDTDTYTENYNKPGTYFLSFYVIDKSQNMSNIFKIKISVEEEVSFLQLINNSHIYTDINHQKSDQEILNILDVDSSQFLEIKSIENTYYNNYNIPGDYNIKYQFTNFDNTYEYININITTYNLLESPKKETLESKKEQKKETIFSKIISFFKSIFFSVASWFKNLF